MKTVLKISDIKKENCCGCTSCLSSCPQNCIKMTPDNEGFLFPSIDNSLCNECGLCYERCPVVDEKEFKNKNFKYKVFASKIKDEKIRGLSTSGGLFTALSKFIFENQGVVCGVVYSEDFKNVKHVLANNWDELAKMRRSKLVQSDKQFIFRDIKRLLDDKKNILFSGTPCEVAGLKIFLGKEYENLFTCDLICGCVASSKVYKNYIEFLENKYNSKVISVNFKDKSQGWHNLRVNIAFENGESYSNGIYDDPYVVSFHSRYNIRKSCFNCKFRGRESWSDITIGDFWGINYIDPKLDDNKGISFVLANTYKGSYMYEKISSYVESYLIDIDINEYGNRYNVCLARSPIGASENLRENFYTDLNKGMSFDRLFDIHLAMICEERKLKKIEYFKNLNRGNDKIS